MTTWLTTFEPTPGGGAQEHYLSCVSIASDEGIKALFKYPVFISQIAATWTNWAQITLAVQLPSGISYTIQQFDTDTHLTLNTRDNSYVYWMQLPAASEIQFTTSATIENFKVSLIANPL